MFLLCSHVSADTIFLRGENKELSATIISWSAEGLRIQSEGKELQELLPWHSIQSITREVSSPSLDEHLQMGKMLFRAKSRLLRGDITLAAPLFEEAFLKLKSSSGKDAYLATEGLLRCKIAKGDIEGAIEPWFCCIVHLKNELPKPFPTLIEVIDSETLLCPNLPPVWSDEAMGNILISLDSNEDAIADFVTVVKRKINTSDTNSLHKGALFLLEVLILMDGEGENYETISSKKMQHISTMPTWQVAWIRYALAVGLLKQ
ncbi:hypothetical protein H8D29_06430, partial [PVC group bacterium]|nr:hypothetical protein [PVC group bacterium]